MPGNTRSVYDAFLCHHSRDLAAVTSVVEWLRRQGLHLFVDQGDLHPGDPIHEDLEQALHRSRCLLVFLSPNSVGRWQTEEAHAFLDATLSEHPVRLIPVLLPGLATEVKQQLPSFFQRRLWVEFERATQEEPALHSLLNVIRRVRNLAEAPFLAPSPVRGGLDSPYPGWGVFQAEDSSLFFGRERLIQQLLLRLHASRFMAVTGPAHVGKSSVIRAGVVPELEAQGWLCEVFIPGTEPLQDLANSIARLQTDNFRWMPKEILEHLRSAGPPIVGVLADQILEDRGKDHALLVIDEFDALFDEAIDDAERARFFQLIAAAARALETRLHVIVTLRSDTIGRCTADDDLNAVVTRNLFQVGPLTEQELRDAILGPALMRGVTLENGLLEQVMADAQASRDPLPLLGHALDRTFQQRSTGPARNTLTKVAYDEIGGLPGSLGKCADDELERLEQRFGQRGVEALRTLFLLHLLHPEMDALARPRRASIAEVRRIDPDSAMMDRLLEEWAGAGLLRLDPEPPAASPKPSRDPHAMEPQRHVQVAHEALLQHWPRLRDWMISRHGEARLVAALRKEEQEWREHGHAANHLLTGSRLIDAENLRARYSGQLPAALGEFISLSAQARDHAESEKIGILQRELRQAHEVADSREKARQEAEARAAMEAQARAQADAKSRRDADAKELAEDKIRKLKLVTIGLAMVVVAIGLAAAAWVFLMPS